jgi:hypothetical protein
MARRCHACLTTACLPRRASPTYDLVVGGAESLATGTHACCLFADDDERAAVVRAFLSEGLNGGERLAVYTSRGAPSVLDGLDVDIEMLERAGQLVIGDVEETYLPEGRFDGAACAAQFAEFAAETRRAGYPALRLYADNGGIPALLDDPYEWIAYELRIAVTIPRYQLIGLCGFHADDAAALPTALLDAVHDRNLSSGPRPSPFHVRGTTDGTVIVSGDVEALAVDSLRHVLAAAKPILHDHRMSFGDVEFADAAGADELHRFWTAQRAHIVDVPRPVSRVWKALGRISAN